MHRALDHLPVNVLLMGKGNTVSAEGLAEQALAGAAAYKVHEDWGSTPAAIDAALRAADEHGLQVALHSDSLNEAGFLESTVAAIAGRSIHAFHTEGAGGGHAPDIIEVASLPHVIPGSTNPTLPHTVNTVAEHLDMLMVCHHLSPRVPEDLAFAESRIRATTIAAEDVLHDMGALSITSSDAQAMGRIGEVICRTWQVAHVMKARRGSLGGGLPADNERARRYVAKYTINPAIAHGIAHEVGSVEVGKLADLVLWDPRFFGIRPELVIKGGALVRAALGDPNASIPTPQPVLMRPTLVDADGSDHAVTFVAPGRARGRPRRPARAAPPAGCASPRPATSARPTWSTTTPCPTSTSTRRRSRSPSTASSSSRSPRPSCRWPSSTRCSEHRGPPLALLLADARLPAAGHTQSAGPRARAGRTAWTRPSCRRTAAPGSPQWPAPRRPPPSWPATTPSTGLPLDAVETAWARAHAERRDARHRADPGPRPAAAGRGARGPTPPRAGRPTASRPGRWCSARSPPTPGCRRSSWRASWRTTTCRPCSPPPSSCSRSTRPTRPRGASSCSPTSTRLADEVATLTASTDIPATGSPQIEGWAQAHARTTRRLFRA